MFATERICRLPLRQPNSRLQPTWPAAFLRCKLYHHGVAGHAAEPWAVRRAEFSEVFIGFGGRIPSARVKQPTTLR